MDRGSSFERWPLGHILAVKGIFPEPGVLDRKAQLASNANRMVGERPGHEEANMAIVHPTEDKDTTH